MDFFLLTGTIAINSSFNPNNNAIIYAVPSDMKEIRNQVRVNRFARVAMSHFLSLSNF